MLPGFASTIPRSTSCFSTPRSSRPTLSPACPSSSSLRNISTPVTTAFLSVPNPTISTSSPRDREDVFHRHQERLVHLALRNRDALVEGGEELHTLGTHCLSPSIAL